jgi:heme oxygenase
MLARLDRETASQGTDAVADRAQLLSPDQTDYRVALSRLWGFEAAVEGACARTVGLTALLPARSRTHMIALRADLSALGVTSPSTLPMCHVPDAFESVGAALGWIYALDRTARGHAQLAKKLANVPATYLSAARDLGALGAACDRHSKPPPLANQVVEAARRAFNEQHQWYAALGFRSSASARAVPTARRATR